MKTQRSTIMAAVAGISLLAGSGVLLAADNSINSGITTSDRRANTEQRGQLSSHDFKFVKEATEGGLAEVRLGELAQQKGVNAQVKSFGQKMIADHTKANNELQSIIAQKGATLPAEQTRHERSTIEHLEKATGADFDKSYAEHMVKDHQKDVKEFQKAAQDLQDADLKAFAQKTLPTLQEHQRLAEQMQAAVGNESSTTTTTTSTPTDK